jgi:hypothetical protein
MAQKHQGLQTDQHGSHQGNQHVNADRTPSDLRSPVRNNYFYGKLLDVFHLEMEQEYFNSKRWLLNRLIAGPGVVCGLKVELTGDEKGVVILPGLAIDRCGREVIVATRSPRQLLPDLPPYEPNQSAKGLRGGEAGYNRQAEYERHYYCEIPFAHVVLCYHECKTDPVPALASDCESEAWCASGSIREQYSIEIRDGFAPIRQSTFPRNVVEGGAINYGALVDFVTSSCRALPDDCCIPLANVELRESDDGWKPEIDNSVRPIVYTNRLLYQLISSLTRKSEEEETEV